MRSSCMNYVCPVHGTCGPCIICTGRYLFQTAFILGTKNKMAAFVLSCVEPLLKKGWTLWVEDFF